MRAIDSPLKPGDYKDEKIKWVDIHTFADGREKVVSLSNIKGNVLIGKVKEDEIVGGIYVHDVDKAVRGTFAAKRLAQE